MLADRVVELRRVKAKDLLPNPSNWRTHSEHQRKALDAVLARVGIAGGLLARDTPNGLTLIDGHLRTGGDPEQEWPVLILDVDDAEAALLLSTFDPLGALAGQDDAKLVELVRGMNADDLALAQLALDGQAKLGELLAGSAGLTDPDEIPEPPKTPISKPGDLWLLGEHRLLCGDSTKAEDVLRVMNGELAAIVATDPPYLVDYTGADRPGRSGKDWSQQYHEIDIQDAKSFFANAVANAVANAAFYWWHAHRRAAIIEEIWHANGLLIHQQIIWVKPSALHGFSFFPWQHEPCFFGWKKGHKPSHDGDNSHSVTTVWRCDWEGSSRIVGNDHPTQKPIEIFGIPIRKHTTLGDICYEPFSGSGSQIIAAEKFGRRCRAIEIEPIFIDVCIERWQNFTGQRARRA